MGRLKTNGLTAVELIVTVAVLATVASFSAPSFMSMIRSSAISSTAQNLSNALLCARAESVRSLSTPFTACPSKTPETADASCGGSWNQGVIVFADLNGNGTREENERIVLVVPPLDSNTTIEHVGTLPYVLFAPGGLLHGGEKGIRFSITHSKSTDKNDMKHLCVLRASGSSFIINDADLQNNQKYSGCKNLKAI